MYQVQRKSYLPWLVIVGVLVITSYVCYRLVGVLTPFVLAIVLAYFLHPVVDRLSHKMPRVFASLLVVLGTGFVILILIAFLVPILVQQIQELIDKMPVVLTWLQDYGHNINLSPGIQSKIEAIKSKLNFQEFLNVENLNQVWQQNNETFKSLIVKITAYAKQTGSGILLLIYNLFMLPIVLFYFLYDWPSLLSKLRKIIPRRHYHAVISFAGELDQAFSQFMRGQFMVMIIMGCIYGIGLSLVGLKNGLAIGFMTGFLVFIPYFGFVVGFILASLAAILQYGNIWYLMGIWLVFGIGQALESFVVTPKLIGDRIGLSPMLVILVLLAFGSLFGFIGMLLALPISAVGVVIVNKIAKRYYQSDFYLEE